MMFETNVSEWKSQETLRKTSIRTSEIESLRLRLSMLLSQKEKLQIDLESFDDDSITEPMITRKQTQRSDSKDFFKTLREHEDRCEELKQKISTEEEIYRNHCHEKRVLSSRIRKLNQESRLLENRLKKEQQTCEITEAACEQLEDKLFEKETKQFALEQDCEQMRDDLRSLTNALNEESRVNYNLIKSRIDELEQLLEDENDRQSALKDQVQALSSRKKLEEDEKSNRLKKARDLREQRKEQVRLDKELRSATVELEKHRRELRIAEERRSILTEKMKDLLGDDDPGDGTGEMAQLILLSKIESVEQKDMNDQLDQLAIENEYNEELQHQMRTVENSWKLLQSERKAVLGELQRELGECQKDSYVKMLQEEYAKLMKKHAKS